MNMTLRLAFSTASMAGLMAIAACSTRPEPPRSIALVAHLSGAREVPAVVTAATGHAEALLAPGTRVLTWTLSYWGLSGPVTGAHFHGPANEGANAGVVIPMTGPLESPITGTTTLTVTQAEELTGGQWYVNLHTAANPGGEARGQLGIRR